MRICSCKTDIREFGTDCKSCGVEMYWKDSRGIPRRLLLDPMKFDRHEIVVKSEGTYYVQWEDNEIIEYFWHD